MPVSGPATQAACRCLEYFDHVVVTWFALFNGEADRSGNSRVKRIEEAILVAISVAIELQEKGEPSNPSTDSRDLFTLSKPRDANS
jgi:hypothetical protein